MSISHDVKPNNKIVVSVIMLSYNHERYIKTAIESVLSQITTFEFEVLVGDDASTDESLSILREYADKDRRIRLFERKQNVGTTKNAYLLFSEARGKYLASCESDDFWTDPYKLQKQVDFLEEHPEYIGCSHNVVCVGENGKELKNQSIFWISKKKVFKLKDFKGIFLPGHSSSNLRRNIFLNPQFDYSVFYKAHRLIGDRTITMLFLAQGDFYHMDEYMSCYRRRVGNETDSITDKLYGKKATSIDDELMFTENLEIYANRVLNVNIGADYYRRELLATAVWKFCCAPDVVNRRTIIKILRSMNNPYLGCLLIPVNMIKKFMRKYIIKNDR